MGRKGDPCYIHILTTPPAPLLRPKPEDQELTARLSHIAGGPVSKKQSKTNRKPKLAATTGVISGKAVNCRTLIN